MTDEGFVDSASFLNLGGRAQDRYESLRAYMLLPSFQRARSSAARFDLARFDRFGLLGLLARDPVGNAWRALWIGDFEIEIVPIGTSEAGDRQNRLYWFLSRLAIASEGGQDGSRSPLCSGLDGDAGERADDPQPACCHLALC